MKAIRRVVVELMVRMIQIVYQIFHLTIWGRGGVVKV